MIFRKFVSNREEKKGKMNKPLYFGLSILEISKRLMYESVADLECKKGWWPIFVKSILFILKLLLLFLLLLSLLLMLLFFFALKF